MKFNARLFTLAAVAAFPSMLVQVVDAGNPTCDDQLNCISFSVKKLDTDACNVGGECTVEVCMLIASNSEGCSKSGDFSHMCSQTDSSGCPQWVDAAKTIPLLGDGNDDTCSLTGEGPGAPASGGKCEDMDNVLLCQEGRPGQTLYWILKDGNENENPEEHKTYTKGYTEIGGVDNGCTATLECGNYEYKCGSTGNDKQKEKERTWEFTIPGATGGSCDVCTESPTPPTPTPPIGPTPIEPTPTTPTSEIAPTPGSNGDPHFKTWKNEHFEYHGQCDLILTKDENFADGLGLDIQLRTKLVRYWSYIRNAAIRIGHDIIELGGSDDLQDQSIRYWYNMQFRSNEAKTLGGFPMTIRRVFSKVTKIEIDLSSKYPGAKIVMSTYKEFVKVEVEGATEEAFGNTIGLLGDFKTGKTLARDGETYLHDFSEYGNEWQVSPMDDMLFHSTEEPQFPSKCLTPEDPRGDRRRRLDESSITFEQAENACATLRDPLDRKDCVYDILATQDMDMVGAF